MTLKIWRIFLLLIFQKHINLYQKEAFYIIHLVSTLLPKSLEVKRTILIMIFFIERKICEKYFPVFLNLLKSTCEKITISNFKGIKSPLQLDLYTVDNNNIEKESNLLLYAENGGGKTSISEAIRLISFANFIEEEVISPNIVGEEREAAKRDWLNSYLHDQSNDVFEIDIDGNKFSSTSPDAMPNKNVFILDRLQLRPTSKIKLENLIGKNHFGGPYSYEQLSSSEIIDMVLSDVNDILKNEFKEKIELVRPESEEKIVGISGIIEGIITENIHEKLNEAHQNLIKILIFISYVKLAPKLGDEKKYFVVFDDVMSSLDLANRIVLARILINLGKEYQLLLMTHNVGFYNLIKHISGINHTNENWRYTSLYQIDGTHIMYSISEEENVDELVKNLVEEFCQLMN